MLMQSRQAYKVRWRVVTDMGTIETMAATVNRAVRNARYRIAMSDRAYPRPKPEDRALMRDIEVIKVERAYQ